MLLTIPVVFALQGANLSQAPPGPRVVMRVDLGYTPLGIAIDHGSGRVASLGPNGVLDVIDEITRRRSSMVVPQDSFGVAADSGDGHIYVTNGSFDMLGFYGGLSRIDPIARRVDFVPARFIGFPSVDSTTHRVYVTQPYVPNHTGVGLNSIAVYDGETLERGSIRTGGDLTVALAIDESHGRIYVAAQAAPYEYGEPQPVTVVDASTEAAQDVGIGCSANLIAADPHQNWGWAACTTPSRIVVIRPGVNLPLPVDSAPRLLVVDPSTGRAYAALEGQTDLLEFDPELRTLRDIPLLHTATDLAVDPLTGVIYASHSDTGTVTLIDGVSLYEIEVEVGPGANQVAVDSDRKTVVVSTDGGLTLIYGPSSHCGRCPSVVPRPQ